MSTKTTALVCTPTASDGRVSPTTTRPSRSEWPPGTVIVKQSADGRYLSHYQVSRLG